NKNLRLVQVSPDVSSSVPIISSSDFTIIIIFPFVFYNNGLFSMIGRGANTHPTGKGFFDSTTILRRMRGFVFRCGPLLSAGTASASSEAKTASCGIFSWDCAYSSHQKTLLLFPQESTALRSNQPSQK